MKKTFTILTTLFFLFSVATIAQQTDNASPIEAAKTSIEFETTEFYFGEIEAGEKIQTVFEFTNTGDIPLILSNAKGSCGCTVPEWPKEPILTGETGYIVVQFDSKSKRGKQSKRVTITANTNPAQTFLTVKGEVYNSDEVAVSKPTPTINAADLLKKSKSVASDSPALSRAEELDIYINQVTVFPNPARDQVRLKMKVFEGQPASIEIYNSNGQRVLQQQIDEVTADPVSFDIHDFAAGSYTISIKVADGDRIVKHFVIAR